MMKWLLIRLGCLWRGHDDLLIETADRMLLRCQSCGSESSGLVLDTPRPKLRGAKVLRFKKRMADDRAA